MAERRRNSRQYKTLTLPVSGAPETTQIDKWQPNYPTMPTLRQSLSVAVVSATFFWGAFTPAAAEVITADKWQPNYPSRTLSLKATPQYYPYLFRDVSYQPPKGLAFYPDTTRTLKSTPYLYPYLSFDPTDGTFPERVQLDKFHPIYPDTTSSLKSRPHLTPYLFFYPSDTNFKEAVHGVDVGPRQLPPISFKSTPHLYAYLFRDSFPVAAAFDPSLSLINNQTIYARIPAARYSTPQYYPYNFINSSLIIPNVGTFQQMTSMPRMSIPRFANYMSQPSTIFVAPVVVTRVFNLPLLGVC